MARVSRLSIAFAAILASAIAQTVVAGTTIVGSGSDNWYTPLSNTPVATISSSEYPSTSVMAWNALGNFILYGKNFSSSDPDFGDNGVYYFSAAGASAIAVGPRDTVYSAISVPGPTIYITNFSALGSTGAVVGNATRWAGVPFNYRFNPILGQDAFVYLNGSNTVISSLGALAATNASGTYDGNAYYSLTRNFNADGTANPSGPLSGVYRTAGTVAVNSANQVIGTSIRYAGVSNDTTSLGLDAWVYTPGAATPVAIMGLTDLAHTHIVTDNSVNYSAWTNTPLAMNSSGSVIGNTTNTGSSFTNDSGVTGTTPIYVNYKAGTDAWLYTPASGTTRIGITGMTITVDGSGNNVYTNQPAALGGYYSVLTQGGGVTYVGLNSAAGAIYNNGVVTGTTQVYGSPTNSNTQFAKNIPSLGQEAWMYTPSSTPGMAVATSTGGPYGTTANGTYKQMGLLSGTSTNGYVYVSSGGYRSSSISVLDSSGNMAGTSAAYAPNGTSASGADAWYYKASTGVTTNITPTAGPYSTYLVSITSTSSVTMMNSTGMVGGTQARYGPSISNFGADIWIYDPSSDTTNVIVSPNIIATNPAFASVAADASGSEDFQATLSGLTNSGTAYGYFTAYTGGNPVVDSSSTVIGTYAYIWTKAKGTMILGGMSPNNTIAPLSSTAWASLLSNPTALTGSLFMDAAGNVYGLGSLTSGSAFAVYDLMPAAPGDVNMDGTINLKDYLATDAGYTGNLPTTWANGDFNHDGIIDYRDYAIIDAAYLAENPDVAAGIISLHAGQFGAPYVAALTALVPEPSSLLLLSAGAIGMLSRRRRS